MFAVRSVMHRALATLISSTFGLPTSTVREEMSLALNQEIYSPYKTKSAARRHHWILELIENRRATKQ